MSRATVKKTGTIEEDSSTESESIVHLKGEIHSSRGDHDKERELMKEGIDALVLEGTKNTGDYGVTEGWFQQAIAGMFYILSPLYVSKEILVDFAELQGANVYFTRESDAEVLRNAPLTMRVISASLYFLLLPSSVIVGLITGDYLAGAGFLAVSFSVPVLLLRFYNMEFNSGDQNRDEVMAQKIADAAEENDTVLAVVGAGHADGIIDALPKTLNVTYHPPEYGRASKEHLKEILIPLFQTFSLLLTLYLAILWIIVTLVGFL
jgi:fermentation-respiration switch protein FrsA (DUF1100 family)